MSATYEMVRGRQHDRQHRLQAHCHALGLDLTVEPSPERAMALTDLAWTRDGGIQADAALEKVRMPWVASGRVEGRDVAVFMVNGAPGSVFAARLESTGAVVRVYSRYGMTSWTYAIGFLAYLIVGPIVFYFLWRAGWESAAWAVVGLSLMFGWSGLRQTLALLGVWKVKPVCNSLEIGGAEFQDRFAVVCNDAVHAARVLTPEVQRLMLDSVRYGAGWWSIGQGWASCVSRLEPISRTHGGVMKEDVLRGFLELVASTAQSVDDADRRAANL